MRALGLGVLLVVCAGCVGQYGLDVPPPPSPVVIVPAPVVVAPVYVVPAPAYYYRPYYYGRR